MLDWGIAAVAIKALLYASCLTAGGGALFLAIFGAPLERDERARVVGFVRAAAVFGLYILIARMFILSAMLGDDVASMWDWSVIQIVLESSEGIAAAVRALGLIAIAAFSFGGGSQAIALTGAVLTVGSFALTGHTGAPELGEWPRVVVLSHLLAASYWIGALAPLYMIAAGADSSRIGAILKRFGDVAVFVITGLVAAGATLLWLMLGSFEALLSSSYGQFVLVKIGLVVMILGLAALNKLRFTPGILSGDRAAAQSLRRSIMAEMALAAAILVVTATFTTVVGPPVLE